MSVNISLSERASESIVSYNLLRVRLFELTNHCGIINWFLITPNLKSVALAKPTSTNNYNWRGLVERMSLGVKHFVGNRLNCSEAILVWPACEARHIYFSQIISRMTQSIADNHSVAGIYHAQKLDFRFACPRDRIRNRKPVGNIGDRFVT